MMRKNFGDIAKIILACVIGASSTMIVTNRGWCLYLSSSLPLYSVVNIFIYFGGTFGANRSDAEIREFYSNKIILAPMVRMNTLPFRLLCLDYGADLVYSEEIVDYQMLRSTRHYNETLDTIDYVDRVGGTITFRTCSREKGKVIFQIGTSDPERAARVAQFVAKDVAGIDINMGCPKRFSVAGGMGAALLCKVGNAKEIIESVRSVVDLPVTCKIRVHNESEETISFCKRMVDGGAAAIAIHGRTQQQRPANPNQIDLIKNVSSVLSIPVIANGDSGNIKTYDDILKFKRESGCTSVMIARAAQDNPSIFRTSGKLPSDDVIKEYLKYTAIYCPGFSITKYCIQKMLGSARDSERGKRFMKSATLEQIFEIWDMDEYYRNVTEEYKAKRLQIEAQYHQSSNTESLKQEPTKVYSQHYHFARNEFLEPDHFPKSVLQIYAQRHSIRRPRYELLSENERFRSIVTFNDSKYTSTYWERSKKSADQAAAGVCLNYLKQQLGDDFLLK